MALNVVLIVAHFLLFLRYSHRCAPLMFSAFAIAMGPILLHRFELLVSVLVLAAWLLFQRNRAAAGFLLGLAISTKVYPAIFLPLLFGELLRQRQYLEAMLTGCCVALGAAIPTAAVLLFGGSVSETFESMRVHQLKPISLEGIWGNVITVVQKLQDTPIRMDLSYGIHGMASDCRGSATPS